MAVSGECLISRLILEDGKLCEADKNYLLVFFGYLGLNTISDLRDIDCFEPVASYLRASLVSFQQQRPQDGEVKEGAGAVRAALGRLLRTLEVSGQELPKKVQGQDLQQVPVSSPPGASPCQGSARADARGRQQRQPQQQKTTRAVSPVWAANMPTTRATIGVPRQSSPFAYQLQAPAGTAATGSRRSSPRRDSYESTSNCSGNWGLTLREGSASQLGGSFSRAGSRQNLCRQTIFSRQEKELEARSSPGPQHYRPTMMQADNRRPASPRATIGTARRDTSSFLGVCFEAPSSPRQEERSFEQGKGRCK